MNNEPIIEDCEFYMVWTKWGRKPGFIHGTALRAEAEAERLARANPGKKYIVLRGYTKLHVPTLSNMETVAQTADEAVAP